MLCTHYKKTNHTVENCYFKHGFPPGYRTKSQATALQASADNSKAPSSHTSSNTESSISISKEDYNHLIKLLEQSKQQEGSSSMAPITRQQHLESPNHFVSSMNKSGISISHSHSWVLDSGASDHVSPFIHLFSKLHSIDPIPIQFPDGTNINAHFSGTIFIS